jgi:hypothetical protein
VLNTKVVQLLLELSWRNGESSLDGVIAGFRPFHMVKDEDRDEDTL